MTYGVYFLLSLLLTLVVELPLLLLLTKYFVKNELGTRKVLYWGAFVNLLSIPYLWFVFPLFTSTGNYIYYGELLVVVIELLVLKKVLNLTLKRAFLISLLINLCSYLAGFLLEGLLV